MSGAKIFMANWCAWVQCITPIHRLQLWFVKINLPVLVVACLKGRRLIGKAPSLNSAFVFRITTSVLLKCNSQMRADPALTLASNSWSHRCLKIICEENLIWIRRTYRIYSCYLIRIRIRNTPVQFTLSCGQRDASMSIALMRLGHLFTMTL